MKPERTLLILLIAVFTTGIPCTAQEHEARRVLLLERPGTVVNYKYGLRERIILKSRQQPERISGSITAIRDSSLVINHSILVPLKDIETIYRERWVMHWLPVFLLGAGTGYLAIDVINNLITGSAVFQPSVLQAGGILAGAGLLLMAVPDKRYPCDNRRWRVKILDFEKLRY